MPITSASAPEQKKLRTASRGVITRGSPNRLNEVFTSSGAAARSPKRFSNRQNKGLAARSTTCRRTRSPGRTNPASRLRPWGRTEPIVVIKRPDGEQSKYCGQSSAGTEIANGRNASRCFTYSFRFSLTYGAHGEASRLRLPRARGPNSAAPWCQPTILPASSRRRTSSIFWSSLSCQRCSCPAPA